MMKKINEATVMTILKIKNSGNLSQTIKAIEKYDSFSVVQLVGAIDFNTIPPIEAIMKAHEDDFDQDIVLDFKEVTHIDTSTLAVVVYVINKMKQKHRKLSLINCNKLVREYVKIGKLESLIHIYNTLEEATNAVNK
ncbi:MAG: STAS domain-containing protein [Candidatus Omnitrophica bacterium]|nr:STAS domain-containing protein [Candidatus Omnitrophota bacterium]